MKNKEIIFLACLIILVSSIFFTLGYEVCDKIKEPKIQKNEENNSTEYIITEDEIGKLKRQINTLNFILDIETFSDVYAWSNRLDELDGGAFHIKKVYSNYIYYHGCKDKKYPESYCKYFKK